MKSLIDSMFNTEFSYREEIKNYFAIQSSLIVRETMQHNWDKAIQIATETNKRLNDELNNYRGRSNTTYRLFLEYIAVTKKGISEFTFAKVVFS